MKFTLTAALFILCLSSASYGQSPVFRQFSFSWENDFFDLGLKGTDRYYTGGFFFNYRWSGPRTPRFLDYLTLQPRLAGSVKMMGLSLIQKSFTPSSIDRPQPIAGDYNYAGLLYAEVQRTHFTRKQWRQSALQLGVLGPGSYAQQTQETIHKAINYIQPLGWEYQVPNHPLIAYRLAQRWNLPLSPGLSFVPGGQALVGTVENSALLEAGLVLSSKSGPFLEQMALERKQQGGFSYYLMLTPGVKVVATNAVLQGVRRNRAYNDALHQPSPGPTRSIEHFLGNVRFKMGAVFRHMNLSYEQTWQSNELPDVAGQHWGKLTLGWQW